MLRYVLGFAIASLLSILTFPALAMSLSENGATATLQGSINPGDEAAFRAFLAQPRAQKIKVLYLYSHGGQINAGIAIAHAVREAHLTTAVRAGSEFCDSTCTLIFAGGVKRHYIDGDQVSEGLSSSTGLGYHSAHQGGMGRNQLAIASEAGNMQLAQAYAELGTPRAADLLAQAPFDNFYRISGSTALKLHIATSLREP